MRIAALIPLVGCICNVLLAFFVLFCAPRAMQNRVYFFLGLFISVWNLGQFFESAQICAKLERAGMFCAV